MDLYVLKYNNYYNRIVKREVDLSSYLTAGTLIHTQYNINYAPGDGVNMRQVLNSETYGDYAIYAEGNTIVSRWFIIEASRNCKGQFGLTLRRDLVVDNFDTVLNADTFIEKAILPDSDPMIFNKEQMTVNQIKSFVKPIKDTSHLAYIVGYIDKAFSQEKRTIPKSALATVNTLAGFESDWGSKIELYDKNSLNPTWQINTRVLEREFDYENFYTQNIRFDKVNNISVKSSPDYSTNINILKNKFDELMQAVYNSDKTTLINALSLDSPQAIKDMSNLLSYNGKIVLDTENSTYYKINITSVSDKFTYNLPASGTSYNALNSIVKPVTNTDANEKAFIIEVQGNKYSYTKTAVPVDSYEYTIDVDHQTLNDQIYDMFIIPYWEGANTTLIGVGTTPTRTFGYDGAKAGLAVANDLIKANSSNGKLKDIQILPYFPMPSIVTEDSSFGIPVSEIKLPDNTYVSWIKDSKGNNVNAIIWCNQSQFEFTVQAKQELGQVIPYTDNVKLSNECDLIRLVAPNHQSMFEFNPAKNGSKANDLILEVECTYKPYQPSIHVKPQFDKLYGPNDLYKDERGLLFSGDFSMTQGTDAWTQYKRQNVNYLNVFDRQIQNMETTYEKQRLSSIVGGSFSAAGAGAGIGSLVGGKLGVGAGLVSAGASIGGMLGDLAMQDQLQSEALNYKRDMFNYQLGNIKAMPDTISKIDAFNNVFALWPVIEYYTCTEEEKKAVANKIAYNSMSVGRIGKIKDFKDNKWSYGDITSKGYIKGSLIRVNIDEDTHYINELANEIYKGVYF